MYLSLCVCICVCVCVFIYMDECSRSQCAFKSVWLGSGPHWQWTEKWLYKHRLHKAPARWHCLSVPITSVPKWWLSSDIQSPAVSQLDVNTHTHTPHNVNTHTHTHTRTHHIRTHTHQSLSISRLFSFLPSLFKGHIKINLNTWRNTWNQGVLFLYSHNTIINTQLLHLNLKWMEYFNQDHFCTTKQLNQLCLASWYSIGSWYKMKNIYDLEKGRLGYYKLNNQQQQVFITTIPRKILLQI